MFHVCNIPFSKIFADGGHDRHFPAHCHTTSLCRATVSNINRWISRRSASIPANLPFQQAPSGSTPLGRLTPHFMLWLHQQVFDVDSSHSWTCIVLLSWSRLMIEEVKLAMHGSPQVKIGHIIVRKMQWLPWQTLGLLLALLHSCPFFSTSQCSVPKKWKLKESMAERW